ncbi:DNA-directed RNA polymerase [Gonapodya sp. JEL0774]|nr:DNA-directed RNA polymerase [Gonapodya sp. JEL0774]
MASAFAAVSSGATMAGSARVGQGGTKAIGMGRTITTVGSRVQTGKGAKRGGNKAVTCGVGQPARRGFEGSFQHHNRSARGRNAHTIARLSSTASASPSLLRSPPVFSTLLVPSSSTSSKPRTLSLLSCPPSPVSTRVFSASSISRSALSVLASHPPQHTQGHLHKQSDPSNPSHTHTLRQPPPSSHNSLNSTSYDALSDLIDLELFSPTSQSQSFSRSSPDSHSRPLTLHSPRTPHLPPALHSWEPWIFNHQVSTDMDYTLYPLTADSDEDTSLPNPPVEHKTEDDITFFRDFRGGHIASAATSPSESVSPSFEPLPRSEFLHQLSIFHALLLSSLSPTPSTPSTSSRAEDHPFLRASRILNRLRKTNANDVYLAFERDPRAVQLLEQAEEAWNRNSGGSRNGNGVRMREGEELAALLSESSLPPLDPESWLAKVKLVGESPTLSILTRLLRHVPSHIQSQPEIQSRSESSFTSSPAMTPDPSVELQILLDRLSLIASQARFDSSSSFSPTSKVMRVVGRQSVWEWAKAVASRVRGENVQDEKVGLDKDATRDKDVRTVLEWIGADQAGYLTVIEVVKVLTSQTTATPHFRSGSPLPTVSGEINGDSINPMTRMSAPYHLVANHIGLAVQREYAAKCVAAHRPSFKVTADPRTAGEVENDVLNSRQWRRIKEVVARGRWPLAQKLLGRAASSSSFGALDFPWHPVWPHVLVLRVGAFLLDALILTAKVLTPGSDSAHTLPDSNSTSDFATAPETRPAFHHRLVRVAGADPNHMRTYGVVMADDAIADWAQKVPSGVEGAYLPMVVEPREWTGVQSGGYFGRDARIMHTSPTSPEQLAYLRAADSRSHLSYFFSALTYLGSTPWQINQAILSVVLEVWNSGLSLGDIPPEEGIIPGPAPFDRRQWSSVPADDKDAKRTFAIKVAERAAWLKSERERFSGRCDMAGKIAVACAFAEKKIYFPHYVDFRGRAYPIPPNLNHVGNDLSRGLLQFYERKPLGVRGVFWLRVHLANTYGFDKAPFDDRAKWVDENWDEILDSAKNPLEGRRWWTKADAPFQCLAACKEIVAASEHPNGAEAYCCGLPVQLDGSCNGLQHYAALGGDSIGAKEVNLMPGQQPGDVYTGVAKIVSRLVEDDATAGIEVAKIARGKVNRALVKQTVMTQSYGVTFIGAREQINNRLKEAKLAGEHDLSDTDIFRCASYLAKLTNRAVAEMFTGARGIQEWLNKVALIVCSSVDARHVDPRELIVTEVLETMGIVKNGQPVRKGVEAVQVDQMLEELSGVKEDHEEPTALRSSPSGDEAVPDSSPATDLTGFVHDSIVDSSGLVGDLTRQLPPEKRDNNSVTVKRPRNRTRTYELPGAVLRNTTLVWTTPLGLPVVQPYRDLPTRSIKTRFQNLIVSDPTLKGSINHMKQSSAFPPNFIHSLDATHMMLTALHMKALGLPFAAVHDSFWAHPANVDDMARVLREEFVRLHDGGSEGRGVMRKLRDELLERYGSNKVPVRIRLPRPLAKELWVEVTAKEAERGSNTGSSLLDSELGMHSTPTLRGRRKNADKPETNKTKIGEKRLKVGALSVMAWVELRHLIPELPPRGNFDIRQVKESPYFFH